MVKGMQGCIERLYLVFALLVLSSFSTASEARSGVGEPKVLPLGWETSYDYNGSLRDYLKNQFEVARQKGLKPYVYFYSDRDRNCKEVRGLTKRKDMQAAFAGTHVVMLDFFRLRASKKYGDLINFRHSNFQPSIFPIRQSGALGRNGFLPVMYLFYPYLVDEKAINRHSIKNKLNGLSKNRFARRVKQYIDES